MGHNQRTGKGSDNAAGVFQCHGNSELGVADMGTYVNLKNQARHMPTTSSHILHTIRGLVEQPSPFETHWTKIVNLANVAHYLAVGEWAQTKLELVVNADQAVLGFATDKIASWDTPNHNLEMLVNELRGFSATHLRPTGWEIAGLGAGLQVVGLHLIDHGTAWED